jgi:hypothetical protein
LKNFIVISFLILVATIWYLLSIDYFGIYNDKSINTIQQENNIIQKEQESKYLLLQQAENNISAISVSSLIKGLDKINKLPFNGIIIYGESFTDKIMKNQDVKYQDILDELKPLRDSNTSNIEIFLLVDIDFPGDFWDNNIWSRITKNFSNLAKATKDLGFKGIVIDTTPKSQNAYKMINFKFPSIDDIEKNSTIFDNWEIRGAKYYKSQHFGYRNRGYSFLEHIKRVTQLFRKIMVAITTNYPDITLLVYSGVDLNQNRELPNVYKKALFLGLQRGADDKSTLYDMAFVNPKFTKEIHFQNSYFWRKYGVVEDRYNDDLNSSWQWKIPKSDRKEWIDRVKVGFIIDTNQIKNISQITSSIVKALKYSDGYVILFSNRENWIDPKNKRRVKILKKRIEKILKEN